MALTVLKKGTVAIERSDIKVKHKLIDKPCYDCGVIMIGVKPMQMYCDACAKKRNRKNAAAAKKEQNRRKMTRGTASPIHNPNEPYCQGFRYWYGKSSGCDVCNYIFVMGSRRPCPPGKGCKVRKDKNKER